MTTSPNSWSWTGKRSCGTRGSTETTCDLRWNQSRAASLMARTPYLGRRWLSSRFAGAGRQLDAARHDPPYHQRGRDRDDEERTGDHRHHDSGDVQQPESEGEH